MSRGDHSALLMFELPDVLNVLWSFEVFGPILHPAQRERECTALVIHNWLSIRAALIFQESSHPAEGTLLYWLFLILSITNTASVHLKCKQQVNREVSASRWERFEFNTKGLNSLGTWWTLLVCIVEHCSGYLQILNDWGKENYLNLLSSYRVCGSETFKSLCPDWIPVLACVFVAESRV